MFKYNNRLATRKQYGLFCKDANSRIIVISLFLSLFFFSQCSVTRHLEDGQVLVVNHNIKCDNKKVSKDEMANYVKPKTNRQFVGIRIRLGIYNKFQNAEGRVGSWLRDVVGEQPALLDSTQVKKNAEQLRFYMKELGYYQATVTSEIKYKGKKQKKATDNFYVTSGPLYTISNISYHISDSTIAKIIDRTQNSSKLKKGKAFAISSLQEEQSRIVRICNNIGYYAFSKDNVIFSADTTHGPDSVSMAISIKKTSENSLKIHKIVQTKVNQNYVAKDVRRVRRNSEEEEKGTIENEKSPSYVKPNVIEYVNYIEDGSIYSLNRCERTQKMMSSYPIVKMVNLEFTDSGLPTTNDTINIDCNVNISPAQRQSISFEIEGTNTSGDWGAEINTSYTNRNLLHGAEYLTVTLKLAEEYNHVFKSGDSNMKLFNSQEYGVEVDFSTPKFLAPFVSQRSNKRFRAKSNIHLEYNFLQTTDYTRPTADINFGYTWYGKRFLTYNFNPIDLSFIRYYDISDRFNTFINSREYYKYSYEDYMIYSNNFSIVYSNKRPIDTRDYQYFRLYCETSGNLMYLFCNAIDKEKNDNGQYETFGIPFTQYGKVEADFRYYKVFSPKTIFVYRIFGGLTIPYLNSEGLPSVKKYYAGGANSMRAWESRSLGIGSHRDTINSFKYYLGDVKLELNLESRFHLFWLVDGAVFVDAGNIWSFWNDELEGAEFHFKDFYKNVAIGTGVGLRFDFSFLLLRCDVGMKVREAFEIEDTGSHLIWGNRSLTRDDFNISFGIGYPF